MKRTKTGQAKNQETREYLSKELTKQKHQLAPAPPLVAIANKKKEQVTHRHTQKTLNIYFVKAVRFLCNSVCYLGKIIKTMRRATNEGEIKPAEVTLCSIYINIHTLYYYYSTRKILQLRIIRKTIRTYTNTHIVANCKTVSKTRVHNSLKHTFFQTQIEPRETAHTITKQAKEQTHTPLFE